MALFNLDGINETFFNNQIHVITYHLEIYLQIM